MNLTSTMQTKTSKITYAQTSYFSKLILDYISGAAQLKPFYNSNPELDSFTKAIENKAKQIINRKLLVEVIEQQYKTANCELPTANCQLLLDENTYTITTGHQLCLFTGPLYFIYKIITTINLSEELKTKYPTKNFVPVYWMASEDHDFAEVNHIHLFGKKIEWNPAGVSGANPVGKIATDSIAPLLEELKSILGESDNAKNLIELFIKSYLPSKNLSEATRIMVHELFGRYGLVILDADDKALKTEFSEIMLDDLKNHHPYNLVSQSIKQLETLGYKAQVNPREINCFYMKDNFRERIIFEKPKYKINNTDLHFSETEMESELKNYPERFSPNVVLRPLYQEKILPNLAYIGGGGELAYWLEFKSIFDFHEIQFPILVLRNSVLWIDAVSSDKWHKFGFSENDYFNSIDDLVRNFMLKNSGTEISLAEEQESLKAIFTSIGAKAQQRDATLKAPVEAELQKALTALSTLENKMLKAEKQKQETSLNQLKKIKEKLFPEGQLQERYDNFSTFYLKYGQEFIVSLKENLALLDSKFTVIAME